MKIFHKMARVYLIFLCFFVSASVLAGEYSIEGWKTQVEAGGSIDHFGRL